MSLFRRKLFTHGIPFILLVVGGSFGLKEFTQLRYTYRKGKSYLEGLETEGIKLKDPSEVNIEKEYEKLQQVNLDNWQNKRIPRPWDESLEGK